MEHGLVFKILRRNRSTRLIYFVHDMGSHDQAGLGGRGLHQRFEGLRVVNHHALEGAGDVRKDALRDEIPLSTTLSESINL